MRPSPCHGGSGVARGRCLGDLQGLARREGWEDQVCEEGRMKRLRSLLRGGMGAEVDW
jgi:hypothetical protein